MSAKDKSQIDTLESFEWNVENEIHLFNALIDYRPVGPHRHFIMSLVVEKFAKRVNKIVHPDIIWQHLNTMYDMDQLNDLENSLKIEEEDFMLPESEYSTLIQNKKDACKSYKPSAPKIKLEVKESIKTPNSAKKTVSTEKINTTIARRDSSAKEDKTGTPKSTLRTEDKKSAIQKGRPRKNSEVGTPPNTGRVVRPTRGSLKPGDNTPTRGRSPAPTSTAKRRRTRTDALE